MKAIKIEVKYNNEEMEKLKNEFMVKNIGIKLAKQNRHTEYTNIK